jgi:hypothetical protein
MPELLTDAATFAGPQRAHAIVVSRLLGLQLHAPLVDNSPFPGTTLDDALLSMDTINIAEEASRMATALAGAVGAGDAAAQQQHPSDGSSTGGTSGMGSRRVTFAATPSTGPGKHDLAAVTALGRKPGQRSGGAHAVTPGGGSLSPLAGPLGVLGSGSTAGGGGGGSSAAFLEAANAQLLERLVAAEARAASAEASATALRDQIATMTCLDDVGMQVS